MKFFIGDVFRVDWSQLYDKDHYKNQELIYKRLRPTLLSNTLVVPSQKIRDHIRDLAANDFFGLKQQVEAFHRTTRKSMDIFERPTSVIHVDPINHLQTYTIEVLILYLIILFC